MKERRFLAREWVLFMKVNKRLFKIIFDVFVFFQFLSERIFHLCRSCPFSCVLINQFMKTDTLHSSVESFILFFFHLFFDAFVFVWSASNEMANIYYYIMLPTAFRFTVVCLFANRLLCHASKTDVHTLQINCQISRKLTNYNARSKKRRQTLIVRNMH